MVRVNMRWLTRRYAALGACDELGRNFPSQEEYMAVIERDGDADALLNSIIEDYQALLRQRGVMPQA